MRASTFRFATPPAQRALNSHAPQPTSLLIAGSPTAASRSAALLDAIGAALRQALRARTT